VENDPASAAARHDPQLKIFAQVTITLKKNPVVFLEHPPYPDYQKK
jgi:hypothetical protein